MRGTLLFDTAPADRWEDAFGVGNGRHGALAYGRPGTETVIVTHHRLTWPDTPAPPAGPPDLAVSLPRVRDLLLAGESRRALELFASDRYIGDGLADHGARYHPRPFHPAFAVSLRDERAGSLRDEDAVSPRDESARGTAADGYRRTLNYRAGLAVAAWPGRRHACFASRVRDLVVQQVSGTLPDLAVEINTRLPGAPAGLRVTAQARERSAGDAMIVTAVQYPGHAGGYVGATRVVSGAGGMVMAFSAADSGPGGLGGVHVSGCRELTVLTRVEAFGDCADLDTARDRALTAVTGAPVYQRGLLLAEHARAHARAFGEVSLDLGVSAADRRLGIGQLLTRQEGHPDQPLPALLEKLFDSGRYLLLSASGLLPSRLTGLWQGDWRPAWSGAITTDANLGLQLAGAVTTDVPDAVDAVASLVREQLPDWRVNARRLFGARGIVAPAHTDGASGLCTHFEPRWPLHMWTAAADWLLVPVLDEALARCDPGYATRHAGPALRELAAFYEDFLTRTDCDGRAIFAPSYSPENEPGGWTPAAVNAAMDIAAARHALLAAADAGQADTRQAGGASAGPGADDEPDRVAQRRWRELADRLPPYRITPDGALAEWAWPAVGTGRPPLPANDQHRHVSHLYPVWPLHEITVDGTPALAAAALAALRARGAQDDSAHGYLHKALAAARLRDPGLAGRLVAALTGQGFFFRSLMSSHYPGRRVCNADAACAMPGVLAEMLVDSVPAGENGPGRIELLPAVPEFLPSGCLRGIRTLTGVRIAKLRWDAATGEAEAILASAAGREADVSCWRSGRCRRVRLSPGVPFRMTWRRGEM